MRVKDLERDPSGFSGGRGRVVSLKVLGWAIQRLGVGVLWPCCGSTSSQASSTSSKLDMRSRRILRMRLPVNMTNSLLTLSMSLSLR